MVNWRKVHSVALSVVRWWWIIVLSISLASGTAWYMSQSEPSLYVARTSLMVGNTLGSTVPDPNQLGLSTALARAYSELARREPILQPVVQALQLRMSWQTLSDKMLQTEVVPSANLLEISITDSSPDRAAAIANAIGEQLITYSPAAPDKLAAEQQALSQQLQESDTRVRELRVKIDGLTTQRDRATSASDLTEMNRQLDELGQTLENEQKVYRNLLNYKNTSMVNSLSFFERAVPPAQPLASKRLVTVVVAAIAGLLLALAAILVLDRVDQRWRGERDLIDRLMLDDLGSIPAGPPIMAASGDFAARRERAVRDAYTNIMLAAIDSKARSLLITSPVVSKDRTIFSIDLADMFARSSHRVLLVDMDLNAPNLTQLILPDGAGSLPGALPSGIDEASSYLRTTCIPNVTLLPSSLSETTSTLMVPSMRWPELTQQLLTMADIVIFDGPSVLSSADAALLAPHVDGTVLVVQPQQDTRADIQRSRSRLVRHSASRLLGAVTVVPDESIASTDWQRKRLDLQKTPMLPRQIALQGTSGEHQDEQGSRSVIITPPPRMDPSEGEGATQFPTISSLGRTAARIDEQPAGRRMARRQRR